MHLANCTVGQILLNARGPAGDIIAVVACDNGRLAIMRNGVVVPGLSWGGGETEQCVRELMRLTGFGPPKNCPASARHVFSFQDPNWRLRSFGHCRAGIRGLF